MRRKMLVRLAGHDPVGLQNDSRDDQHPLLHMGWIVLIGAAIAGMNWGIGGYIFAGGDKSTPAIGAALLGGVVGTFIVLIIDRSALYAMDTHAGLRLTLWPLVAFRIGLTCFVSSITTHAVAPLFLRPELELKSLDLREESERNRDRELAARYDIPQLQAAAAGAERDVREARQSVQIVPPDIQARLAAARTCWQGYARRRSQLIIEGFSEEQARHRIASVASQCAQAEATAQKLLQEYGTKTRAALAEAEDKLRNANRVVKDTGALLAEKEAYAAAVERAAITPLNSTVLNQLIATDSGARWKFWSAFGLIMGLELMPLLSKLLAPQTVPGIRIATDRIISVAHHLRRRMAAVDEGAVEEALRSSMASAMLAALSEPDLQRFASRVFAAKIAALVPLEVFKALIHEIEAREMDVQSAIRRYPSYARVLTEAWRKTIEETIETLKHAYPTSVSAWQNAA